MTDHQQPTDQAGEQDDVPWEANFAANVRERRLSLRMTQTDLAKAAKSYGLPFHQPTIQRIEKGERPIRLNEALIFSKILRVPLSLMLVSPETEAEVSLAIDEAIFNARSIANYLRGAALDWAGTAVSQLCQVADSKIEEGKPFAEQSPIAKLVLIWAAKLTEMYRVLDSTYERATRMSPGDGSERLADIKGFPVELTERLQQLTEEHADDSFAALSPLPMGDLAAVLDLPDPWKARFATESNKETADGER